MSDIVDRLRNPKRALWYCREFSRGDDESLDIQEAADEIERLRGLLHDWREQWGDGMHPDGDLIDATDAALAGAAVQPSAALDEGWKRYYELRRQVAEGVYPGMTAIVRAADPTTEVQK